jgi:hypothetical protein
MEHEEEEQRYREWLDAAHGKIRDKWTGMSGAQRRQDDAKLRIEFTVGELKALRALCMKRD